MKIAIISDIHSNYYALKAVIGDFRKYNIEKLFILGDIFGYYPWANETYEILLPFLTNSVCIKGNHDILVLSENHSETDLSYLPAAKKNKDALFERNPAALEWIVKLPLSTEVNIAGINYKLVHGTPYDDENGRYYPDDIKNYEWFPSSNEVLLMGHTHYPLLRESNSHGIIFNPGSVGQPRDGNPMPSWGIIDTYNMKCRLFRTNYDNFEVMNILKKMHWDHRAIAALNKTEKGNLKL